MDKGTCEKANRNIIEKGLDELGNVRITEELDRLDALDVESEVQNTVTMHNEEENE